LLVKLANEVTPAGNVILVLIGPPALPTPILATVTVILLGIPTTMFGLGWLKVVVRSGAPVCTAGVVIGIALLLPGLDSPAIGVVPALITNGKPAFVTEGVIGTIISLEPGPGIVVLVVQFTVEPTVAQFQPLLVKLAGADVPNGNVTVAVNGEAVAGALPTLATVMVTGNTDPTVGAVLGTFTVVVKSGAGVG
jgi:hypothetical protein